MRTAGAPRRRLLAQLVPPGAAWVADVGADHGHVAARLGAVATERAPNRPGPAHVPWVVCDGLRALRDVPVAVIAGMGAHTILSILDAGPPPACLVAHAQDDPRSLRLGLAARGWRVEAERLAPEARAHAEVLRAVPGRETATGLRLELGPRLLEGHDPLLRPHLDQLQGWLDGIRRATAARAPDRHAWATERWAHLEDVRRTRGWR